MMVRENLGYIRNRFKIVLAEKETRDKRSYSYREICAITGIATSTLTDWAKGNAKYYAGDTLAALCHFLECKPGDLLEYIPPAETVTEA